ncbi:30S ribosomal protein S6 [bacterium]|nr:30S ribosomal protein S6 [candidate division CSSED10-310 bacterium]
MKRETANTTYETICILNPNLSAEAVEEKINGWKTLIGDLGGEVTRLSRWGKKNLAYEVKRFHQGTFILLHLQGPVQMKDELERQFRISEDVIKFQTVKLNPVQLKISQNAAEKIEAMARTPQKPGAESLDSGETPLEEQSREEPGDVEPDGEAEHPEKPADERIEPDAGMDLPGSDETPESPVGTKETES